jgi:hypothetical protein
MPGLKGKFIELDPHGKYGFEHIQQSMSKPEQTRLVWLVHNVRSANSSLRYAPTSEAVGKEAHLLDGRVSVYCGQGAYVEGWLDTVPAGASNAKATIVEVTSVPKPPSRGQDMRWHHDGYRGFWQKYLKTRGWVRA